MTVADVSVILPVFRAEATVGRAIASALAQDRVGEVIVVDDASGDGTVPLLHKIARSEPRVKIIELQSNGGPASARNRAIDAGRLPWIALLDSDDVFLPGRLDRLGSLTGEMRADNIAFVTDSAALAGPFPPARGQENILKLEDFARGNLPGAGQRGELGFLKPLMNRAFLDRHGLRYDPSLRLGEDVDLYLRALAAGARFSVTADVGYAALERPGSLSGQHRTQDLSRLARAQARILDRLSPEDPAQEAMGDLVRSTLRRFDHRTFLDVRRGQGTGAALRFLLADRARGRGVLADVLRDKRRGPVTEAEAIRYLLPVETSIDAGRSGGVNSPGSSRSVTRDAPGT